MKYKTAAYLGSVLILLFTVSCVPSCFKSAEVQKINSDCSSSECSTSITKIKCDPKINDDALTYTYTPDKKKLPVIKANCNLKDVEFNWVLRRADAKRITTSVSDFIDRESTEIDLTHLGRGVYYLFLEAKSKFGQAQEFRSQKPLEIIVSGGEISSFLTCEPKLNSKYTNLKLSSEDSNPKVTANCSPKATSYYWYVEKNGESFLMPGLFGPESAPDFSILGEGEYKLHLYATLTGSTHWRSSNPLTVNFKGVSPNTNKAIICNPTVNANQKEIILSSASFHPILQANCNSSNLKYEWSILRSGEKINVPDLKSSAGTVNFSSFGIGIYQVYLKASGANLVPWQSSFPLTVQLSEKTHEKNIFCSPRISGNQGKLVIEDDRKSVTLDPGCNLNTADTEWLVFKEDDLVITSDVFKSVSKPNSNSKNFNLDLSALKDGDYDIFLKATHRTFNTFQSIIPLKLSLKRNTKNSETVSKQIEISNDLNKLDILLVIDESKSTSSEIKKLIPALEKLTADLKNSEMDWQMCATSAGGKETSEQNYKWGQPLIWKNYIGNPQWILNAGAINIPAIFKDTLESLGSEHESSDVERGIKAAFHHLENSEENKCYRKDAALAIIVLSDEDEFSVGGRIAENSEITALKNLEPEDSPYTYLNLLRKKFGKNKRFTFNSVIVKPEDKHCLDKRRAESGGDAQYGYKYFEFSQFTDGKSVSICRENYSESMSEIKDRLLKQISAVNLNCIPVGEISAEIRPSSKKFDMNLNKEKIMFVPALKSGQNLTLTYNCAAE